MRNKISRSVTSNQNWLLSYSDLFLLVLSFFVFRYPLLKYEKPKILSEVLTPQVAYEAPKPSINLEANKPENAISRELKRELKIDNNWFSEAELTNLGEQHIRALRSEIETSKTSATISTLSSSSKASNRSAQLTILIANLKKAGIKSLKIEQTLKSSSTCGINTIQNEIGCLKLEY
jgi:hypothetical protein